MSVRLRIMAVAALLTVGWLAFDAAFESDEERVRAIALAFRGEVTDARLDVALGHVDVDVLPLETTVHGMTRVYGSGAAMDLARDARRGLRPVMGRRFRAMRESVRVEDDVAQVGMQLVGEGGAGRVELRLEKREDRWLVRSVSVSR